MAETEMNPTPVTRPPAQFYETISDPPNHPLRMSTLFMNNHGDGLGEAVILTAGGTEWKVWLKVINGGTWLEKGWRGFVEFYSIKEGYLVTFKYEGNSRFLVDIYDETCNEIAYPGEPVVLVPVKVEPELFIAGESGGVKQNPGMSTTVVNGRRLRKRVSGKVPGGISEAKPETPPQISVRSSGEKSKTKPKSSVGKRMTKSKVHQGRRSRWSVMADEQQRIWDLEKAFKSKNPFCVCSMKPSYVSGSYTAGIPVKFLESNFNLEEIRGGMRFSVRLFGEKKKWPVTVKCQKGNGYMRGVGWRCFARENCLKVGQICIYELIKKENVFNLHIFD